MSPPFPILQYILMNFFKQLNSAVDKINALGNLTHQKNLFGGQTNPLTELIRTCTYNDEIKFTIEKSVKQVLQVYPKFTFDKLQYLQGNVQKRFIEIKGEIDVQLRGKIKLNIMYPATFPKTAPYIRIINPNPTEFAPVTTYLALQSKNDVKSFVVNERLESVKKWNSSTSVINVIIEVNNMVKMNFPFQQINQQKGPANNWNGNAVSQGFSQGNSQFPNQYPNQYQNQYPNQYSNQGYNQPAKQPSIPFQTANYANCFPKAHKLVTQQRKKLQQLKTLHQPALSNVQNLDIISRALDSQSFILHTQNQKLLQFVNMGAETESISLSNVVVPANRVSEQVLDLTASVRAREDAIHMLETKFNEEEISFDTFMKNVRKMEEGKFEEKALLIKCLQSFSRVVS